jgi:hypothetical protein
MFTSRQENGIHYLCVRRGRLIKFIPFEDGSFVPITFNSYAKGRECSDELNEKYLALYDLNWDREGKRLISKTPEAEVKALIVGIVETIDKYRIK